MNSGRGYRLGEVVTLDYDAIAHWLLSELPTDEELEVMRERAIERYGFWLGGAAEDCE